MILYLDTSSLIKLYINEQHSDLVHRWAQQTVILCSSRIAYAEALAAASRRWRQGDIDDLYFQRFRKVFAAEWQDFAVVNVNEILAGELAVKHSLRGFDAIHLAAAIEIEQGIGSAGFFFTSFDTRLNEAAVAERFSVLDQNAARGRLE